MTTPPVKINLKMYQGSTFQELFRWAGPLKVYRPITAISNAAPMVITCAGHGMPTGWRFKITNVLGMKEVNSSTNFYTASEITAGTITVNSVNSLGYSPYVSGGVIEYLQPMDLSVYTARMQIRPTLKSETVLLELTTENGGIVLDAANSTITILCTAEQTEDLSFNTAVYSLEMVKPGSVSQILTGSISLEKEVTR